MSTESNNTPVDPRVQIELEKLNTATDNINKYEVELDEAKSEFKRILAESVVRIKQSAHKLGNSIDAAKPYYESRIYASQLAKETKQAAVNFEKAKSNHAAAKEMVYLAEQGLGEKSTLDTACQEMLSHAASKVNQSQLEVTHAHNSLKMCKLKLEVATNRVNKLQSQLRQAIRSSRPYYETRANYNGRLKAQKVKINELEAKVAEAKLSYNDALKNLEEISEEIHRQRQQQRTSTLNNEPLPHPQPHSRNESSTDAKDGTEQQFQLTAQSSSTAKQADQSTLQAVKNISNELGGIAAQRKQSSDDKEYPPISLQDFDAILTFPQKLASGMQKSASISATSENIFAQAQLHGPYEVKSSSSGCGSATGSGCGTHENDDNDIEQWTEIRLSHSESTSSSYSNQSFLHDQLESEIEIASHHSSASSSTSSSDGPKVKVTCTTMLQDDPLNKKQGLSQWLTRSNSFKATGRRQSLDLLIDAGDKVKDVFSLGFQKVGKTLERRNSESEMSNETQEQCHNGNKTGEGNTRAIATVAASATASTTPSTATATVKKTLSSAGNGNSSSSRNGRGSSVGFSRGSSSGISSSIGVTSSPGGEFFLFSRSSELKELLSDEQVENLKLYPCVDENGSIIVEELKSPLQQLHNHIGTEKWTLSNDFTNTQLYSKTRP